MAVQGSAASPARERIVIAGQLVLLLAIMALHPPGHGPVDAGRSMVKLLLVARIVLALGLATWFLRARGLRWADLGLRRPVWRRFAVAIPLGLAAGFALVGAAGAALRMAGVRPADFSAFAGVRGNLTEYLFWGVAVAWGAAAIGEELIFRGFAMDALRRIAGRDTRPAMALAVIGQAVLFGALHSYQGAGGAVTTGTIGLVLGLMWLGSGRNLWAGIVTHGLIDCGSMTLIYLGGTH